MQQKYPVTLIYVFKEQKKYEAIKFMKLKRLTFILRCLNFLSRFKSKTLFIKLFPVLKSN